MNKLKRENWIEGMSEGMEEGESKGWKRGRKEERGGKVEIKEGMKRKISIYFTTIC